MGAQENGLGSTLWLYGGPQPRNTAGTNFEFPFLQIDVVLRTNYQTTSEGLLLSGVRIYIVPPMAVRIVTRLRYLNNNHDSDLYLVSLPYFPCSPIFTYSHTHSHTSAQILFGTL